MNIAQTGEPALRKPLRLWPGVAIVILQWLARFGLPRVVPDAAIFGFLAVPLCGLALIVWWAFFSRSISVEASHGPARHRDFSGSQRSAYMP